MDPGIFHMLGYSMDQNLGRHRLIMHVDRSADKRQKSLLWAEQLLQPQSRSRIRIIQTWRQMASPHNFVFRNAESTNMRECCIRRNPARIYWNKNGINGLYLFMDQHGNKVG